MKRGIFKKVKSIFAKNGNIFCKPIQYLKSLNKEFRQSLTSKMLAIPLSLSCYYFFFKNYLTRHKTFAQTTVLKIPLPDLDSINEGDMREIKYGKNPKETFLLVKYNKTFHSLGNFCPHMGAPLHQGVLFDNVIKCPWHGASFDVVTGTCDTYPSLNGLIKHDIIKEGEHHYALINTANAKESKVPQMAKRDPENKLRFVIIGGGPASLSCAETLRQAGFTGEIVIHCDEPYVAYDRTLLSKNISVDLNQIKLRDEIFLKTYDIDYRPNSKVIGIENVKKIIKLKNGDIEVIFYDIHLLYSTRATINYL
jgi:nitrite reductase/ring-hydroxylating ferredoxin subunit